jgi:hypothetical protein
MSGRLGVLVTLVVLGVAAVAPAQETAPLVAPRQLEVTRPPVPAQMLAPDARALARRLGTAQPAAVPRAPRPSGGGVRTITVPRPRVANPTPSFVFRDVTDRTPKPAVQLSPEQRRAAVDAFRQSLAKRKGARR